MFRPSGALFSQDSPCDDLVFSKASFIQSPSRYPLRAFNSGTSARNQGACLHQSARALALAHPRHPSSIHVARCLRSGHFRHLSVSVTFNQDRLHQEHQPTNDSSARPSLSSARFLFIRINETFFSHPDISLFIQSASVILIIRQTTANSQ